MHACIVNSGVVIMYSETLVSGLSAEQAFCTLNRGFGKQSLKWLLVKSTV
jgi:hypothetical protein